MEAHTADERGKCDINETTFLVKYNKIEYYQHFITFTKYNTNMIF